MVAETEKEFASLPDERVALRRGFRSSGPDSPQISVSGGLPVDLYHGFDRGLALQATLEVEPADKCLSLIFRIVLVISPALIERFDSEEASSNKREEWSDVRAPSAHSSRRVSRSTLDGLRSRRLSQFTVSHCCTFTATWFVFLRANESPFRIRSLCPLVEEHLASAKA